MQSYTHFTREERIRLQEFKAKGLSIREMARQLGRSPSSVSREFDRNSNKDGSYHNWRATIQYIRRRRRCRLAAKLLPGTELYKYVCRGLSKFWSPECIAATWNLLHPQNKISFSTIYRWLKKGLLEGFSRKQHLRRRGKRRCHANSNFNTIHPDRLIQDWPEEIRLRSRIGDWEGDTVYGGKKKGFLTTCVDRKTRFLVVGRVSSRKPDETMAAMLESLEGLPVKSLSLDNGSEFSRFREMEKILKAPIYFAKPHAPWERGTNENTNGLLRFFFPKGFDFISLSDDDLQFVVDLINNRPRKCLGWLSPAQLFSVALD